MCFYVWFALVAAASGQKLSPVVCAALITAFVIAIHLIAGDNAIMNFYARPIVLEFVLRHRRVLRVHVADEARPCSRGSRRSSGCSSPCSLGSLVTLCLRRGERGLRPAALHRRRHPGVSDRAQRAARREAVRRDDEERRRSTCVGEASYIIYLVHPYVIYTVLRLVVRGRELSTPVIIPLILVLLALTSVVAVGIHILFESR